MNERINDVNEAHFCAVCEDNARAGYPYNVEVAHAEALRLNLFWPEFMALRAETTKNHPELVEGHASGDW